MKHGFQSTEFRLISWIQVLGIDVGLLCAGWRTIGQPDLTGTGPSTNEIPTESYPISRTACPAAAARIRPIVAKSSVQSGEYRRPECNGQHW